MMTVLTYPTDELPQRWYWQVLSFFLRISWPEGFRGPLHNRTWITDPSDHPLSFLGVEDTLLLGHVNVVWKDLIHQGTTLKAYGLTGVFTYPSVRGHGYGLRLIRQATDYIDTQAADVALLTCASSLVPFYQRAGWELMPNTRIWHGPQEHPELCEDALMMRFVSARGRQWKPDVAHGDVYFGINTPW